MGRLPAKYAGRNITFRVPFTMPGELIVPAGQVGVQFPEATFLHNSDKPFEIHRVIPRVTGLDENDVVATVANPNQIVELTAPELLEKLTRIRIFDFSKNENLTKNAQLLSSLTKGTSEKTWEWAEPYVLTRSEGFQVTVDNLATANVADNTRVEITFQGFLIVVAPPSESR
jgi:hypothetical protein